MIDLRNPPQWCKCRKCDERYDSRKSRADLTGYCSQKCLIAKARQHGWRKISDPGHGGGRQRTYYAVLRDAGEIGDVEWPSTAMPCVKTKETSRSVWVFTAKCADHGQQVIAVTDYDPEPFNGGGHLWELLERYLRPFVEEVVGIQGHRDSGDFEGSMREHLDQYTASEFQVDKLPVLTLG